MFDPVLYRAILADPDDDGPRERLADWLDAHGEADRAMFVRLQLEDARLPAPDVDSEDEDEAWEARQARMVAVLSRHPEWSEGFPPIAGVQWGVGQSLGFRRGFQESIAIRGPGVFERAMGPALDAAPVSHVLVEGVDEAGAVAIAGCPHLLRVRWLRFGSSCAAGDAVAEAFAASPHASGLRSLQFHQGRVGPAGAAALATSTTLRRDLDLWVRRNPIGPPGIDALRARFERVRA